MNEEGTRENDHVIEKKRHDGHRVDQNPNHSKKQLTDERIPDNQGIHCSIKECPHTRISRTARTRRTSRAARTRRMMKRKRDKARY